MHNNNNQNTTGIPKPIFFHGLLYNKITRFNFTVITQPAAIKLGVMTQGCCSMYYYNHETLPKVRTG